MKKEELLAGLRAVTTDRGSWVVFNGQNIQSYNDDISVKYPLSTGLQCAVPAQELLETISKMSREEIELTVKESKRDGVLTPTLVANDGQTKLTLFGLGSVDKIYTKLTADIASLKFEEQTWQPVPKGFNEGISLVKFSAGSDKKLGKLQGVVFKGQDILSTDNFRVSFYHMESALRPDMMKIDTIAVEKLAQLGNFDVVALSEHWFYTKNPAGIIVAARLMPADYPWDRVSGIFDVLKFDEASEQELPEDLPYAINRVEAMAADSEIDNTTQISLSQRDGSLILQARRNSGEVETTTVNWEGTLPGVIFVSPAFLKKILSLTRKFKVSSVKKGLLFEVPNFKHLMMVQMS